MKKSYEDKKGVQREDVEEKHYMLQGFELAEWKDEKGEQQIGWRSYMTHTKDKNGKFKLVSYTHQRCIAGPAWIEGKEKDLLFIGAWKVEDSVTTSFKKLEEYQNKLPKWNRTKYFIKFADIGSPNVMICETGECAGDEVNKRLARELGYSIGEENEGGWRTSPTLRKIVE